MREITEADDYKIVIGDSVTDFEAAKQADFVIARDMLLERCRTEEIPHQGFETFYDVIAHFKTADGGKSMNNYTKEWQELAEIKAELAERDWFIGDEREFIHSRV